MPFTFEHVTQWAEKHPLGTTAVVVVGGLGALWLLGFFSSSNGTSSTTTDAGTAAYYNAEAAQTATGNQLMALQDQYSAETAIASIKNAGSVAINQAWATAQTAQTESTNQASIQEATIASNTTIAGLETGLISGLLPSETQSGTQPAVLTGTLGGQTFSGGISAGGGNRYSPNDLRLQGYSEAQIAQILGAPGYGHG